MRVQRDAFGVVNLVVERQRPEQAERFVQECGERIDDRLRYVGEAPVDVRTDDLVAARK